MKRQINKIAELLADNFPIGTDSSLIYELSAYISMLYALNGVALMHDSRDNSLDAVISCNFPHIVNAYNKIHNLIDCCTEREILIQLSLAKVEDEGKGFGFFVSDIYQQIKSYLMKTAQGRSSSSVEKVEGKNLLYQTQFFTDIYMVEYLVKQTLSLYDDLSNVMFVDPASGGGNFLTYLYRELYAWYKHHGEMDNIAKLIFENNIVGYDLDAELAEIARLSLLLTAYYENPQDVYSEIYNFGGVDGDTKGYVNNHVCSEKIGNIDFEGVVAKAREQGKSIVYITNPPFMGKRDLSPVVKKHLLSCYPAAKGDLCFSFMQKMMRNLRNGDSMAVVSQNGWLSLSSLKDFRRFLMNGYDLLNCVDLGSNAFHNINGEKTNVVLALIRKNSATNASANSVFVNLRHAKYQEKVQLLRNGGYKVYSVGIKKFSANKNCEFNYQIMSDMAYLSKFRKYGEFAKCMQGSSTGDNATMVKYIWQTTSPEWKLTSKGGGFSKWQGLNVYKVKWGENGEAIKKNRGGVLRNPSQIAKTALVFTDTGTMGLTVRCKLENQVFIASGPGIRVMAGNPLCHMAFLNSRIASFFMRIINPKFTVSGGYIQQLPVADNILDNERISSLAALCHELKCKYLATKLPNIEYRHPRFDAIDDVQAYLTQCLQHDLQNMYERLVAENMIETLISEQYNLTGEYAQEYAMQTAPWMCYPEKSVSIDKVDELLSRQISMNCMPVARKANGTSYGSENCIEMLAAQMKVSCASIVKSLSGHYDKLYKTLEKYRYDFVHKLLLCVMDVDRLDAVGSVYSYSIEEADWLVRQKYSDMYRQLSLNANDVDKVLRTIHPKVFYDTPIIEINE